MIRWLGLSVLSAGLCCVPAARAQSAIDSTSATVPLAIDAPSEANSPSAVSTMPAIGATAAIRVTPAISSATPIGLSSVISSTPEIDAGPVRGGHEVQLWISQSHSFLYISRDVNDSVFQVGGRYGWILTDPIGPGPLRGQFEYAVNFIPLIIPFQPNGPTYGFGLDPFTLKWNFQRRGNIIPYADASAGGMAILKRVPPTGSYWDFTASGGFGVQILRGRYAWSVDCRFYHVSDAGIIWDDPSLNTIEIRVGFGLFLHPHPRK